MKQLFRFPALAGGALMLVVGAAGCADDLMEPVGSETVSEQLRVGEFDWGLEAQRQMEFASFQLFGVRAGLAESLPPSDGATRRPFQPAEDLLALADGLSVDYLTRSAGDKADMFSFWPSDEKPRFLIACIEGGREIIGLNGDGTDKYNPSVQRINLRTGRVDTVLRGMERCDGIRTTSWGTVLATEETTTGSAYEILNPARVTDAVILERGGPGEDAVLTSKRVAKRTALPTMAWEGLEVLRTGVVIGGDELRPGSTGGDTDGGAIFKFVPAVPRVADGPIRDLSLSPLADGTVYAFQASCRGGRQQVGQGCEIGAGVWVEVSAANARLDADIAGATGYYRPEDLHIDPMYLDPANPAAIRFCWANTGNRGAQNWGEVICGVDSAPLLASESEQTVVVNRFLEGNEDMNAPDNLAFQPGTGNLYVIEDNSNGDVFACLKDGADRDIKSDGCLKILSLADSSAEPTGFIFSADGRTAYVSVQHTLDDFMPLVDDYRTDDILVISGFEVD